MLRRAEGLWPGSRPDTWVTIAIASAFVAFGVAAGLIIASQNLVLMALAGGAVLSVVLLNAPAVAVWIVLVGTLVITGPLLFYLRELDRVPWIFSVLGIFLFIASFLHAGLVRRGDRGPVPVFVILGVAFVVYVLLSMSWATVPLTNSGPGARRTVQYWGLFFALALISFPDRTVARWIMFFVVLGLSQFPYALYQRFVVHPTLQHNYVFDSIAGTLEVSWNGLGGASGVLAFMQILLIGAMFAAWREGLITVGRLAAATVALMIPMAIGETNVLFVWLPLVLSAVFVDLIRRHPLRFFGGAVAFFALLTAFASIYLVTQQAQTSTQSASHQGREQTLEERIREVYEYNAGSRGYTGRSDLNRFNVIPHWFQNNGFDDPIAATFGHGVGASFGSYDVRTTLRDRFGERSIDLLTVSAMLWDLGIVGTSLFLATLGFAIRSAYRLTKRCRAGPDRAIARALFAGTVMLLSLSFYNNAIVNTASQQVIAMLILGLTAWMERRYAAGRGAPDRPMPETDGARVRPAA